MSDAAKEIASLHATITLVGAGIIAMLFLIVLNLRK